MGRQHCAYHSEICTDHLNKALSELFACTAEWQGKWKLTLSVENLEGVQLCSTRRRPATSIPRHGRSQFAMPKRTFIPNLLRYRRKHGFLNRLKNAPHILRAERQRQANKKVFPKLGPNVSFCRRRGRFAWLPSWP